MKKIFLFPVFLCVVAIFAMSFKTEFNQKTNAGSTHKAKPFDKCLTSFYVINNAGGNLTGVRLRKQGTSTYFYGSYMGANRWAFAVDPVPTYWLEVEYDNTGGDYNSVSYGDLMTSTVTCEQHTSPSGTNWNQVWDHEIDVSPACGGFVADVVLWPNSDCTQ